MRANCSCWLRISFYILAQLQQAAVCLFISLFNFFWDRKYSCRWHNKMCGCRSCWPKNACFFYFRNSCCLEQIVFFNCLTWNICLFDEHGTKLPTRETLPTVCNLRTLSVEVSGLLDSATIFFLLFWTALAKKLAPRPQIKNLIVGAVVSCMQSNLWIAVTLRAYIRLGWIFHAK